MKKDEDAKNRKRTVAEASALWSNFNKAEDDDADSQEELESSSKKPRRDEEEQFNRIYLRKLAFIEKSMLSTVVADDGVTTPKQFILQEIRHNKQTNGRISTQFWDKLWAKYDFGKEIIKMLPPPPTNQHVDDELLECIDLGVHGLCQRYGFESV